MKKTFLLAACTLMFAVAANAQTDKTVAKPATVPAAVAPAPASTSFRRNHFLFCDTTLYIFQLHIPKLIRICLKWKVLLNLEEKRHVY